MKRLGAIVGLAIPVLGAAAAHGLTVQEANDINGTEAANTLGLIEWCAANGHAGAKDIENARVPVARWLKLVPKAKIADAEALGKSGTQLAAGEQRSMADLGKLAGMSVPDMCWGYTMNVSMGAAMLKH